MECALRQNLGGGLHLVSVDCTDAGAARLLGAARFAKRGALAAGEEGLDTLQALHVLRFGVATLRRDAPLLVQGRDPAPHRGECGVPGGGRRRAAHG